MREITLTEMLEAREKRALVQNKLIEKYGCPIICFTMNIPGPLKNSPLIERAFREGLAALGHRLPKSTLLHCETESIPTGCTAFYAVDMDVLELKKICTAIEDSCELGRLFDMDVIDKNGNKLERNEVDGKDRGCIVCGAPGRGCASRRIHNAQELQKAAFGIISRHFARKDGEIAASLAVTALLDEVCTTPKPGLVDSRNSGSHTDMDIFTFTRSAAFLQPYFMECHSIGRETACLTPSETFILLREAGLKAEERMLSATNGINTHKGAIYTIGLLCGAMGRLWRPDDPASPTDDILRECAMLVRESARQDLEKISTGCGQTAGEKLYAELGLKGIRGEVSGGLPSVSGIALPVFKKLLDEGYSRNLAGAVTLIHLVASVDDTNLYHRGGTDGARFASEYAESLIKNGYIPTPEQIIEMDRQFIARHLSPGGCADLLAAAYFLYDFEKYHIINKKQV